MSTNTNTASAKVGKQHRLESCQAAEERHGELSIDELIWLDLIEDGVQVQPSHRDASAADQADTRTRPTLERGAMEKVVPELQAWARYFDDNDKLCMLKTEVEAMKSFWDMKISSRVLSDDTEEGYKTTLFNAYSHTNRAGTEPEHAFCVISTAIDALTQRAFKECEYRTIRVRVLAHSLEGIVLGLMRGWNIHHSDTTFDRTKITSFNDVIGFLEHIKHVEARKQVKVGDKVGALLNIWLGYIDGLIGLLSWREHQIQEQTRAQGSIKGKFRKLLKKRMNVTWSRNLGAS